MDTYIAPRVAHSDYLARKVIASGAEGRDAVIVACRAEVDWATRHGGVGQEWGVTVIADSAPHVQAAARVLNCWGHLHPTEHRIRATIATIRARKKYGWDVSEQEADLRWYWGERRKQCIAFNAAVEVYHELRRSA
jgi:hypothetical protein